MRLTTLSLVPVAVLAGCTFNTTIDRPADSPNAPRSDSAVVVSAAPKASVLLGTITVRGNRNMIGPACEAQAVEEAKKMGATHVIVRPVESSGSRGVRCIGEAYYLGQVVRG